MKRMGLRETIEKWNEEENEREIFQNNARKREKERGREDRRKEVS